MTILNNFNIANVGGVLGFIAQIAAKGMYYVGVTDKFKQNEKIIRKNKVTSHVLANGGTIDDHVITGPIQISQDFTISILSRSRLAGLTVLTPVSILIEELSQYRGFVKVITSAGVHDNMIIDEMSVEETDDAQNLIKCHLSFIEIRQGAIKDTLVKATSQFDKAVRSADSQFDKARSLPKSSGHLMASWF